ncbi:EF-hand domain-containing protein [Streptosporangium sp. NBC_01755]|uniref:EF-hand domain-containing protein n=1 Tax=Streptosporangium sp. NBC_01755 TaxID=2975949 RepID=UPI002DDA4708|nr:EF-hand domain-containing protein [Streptosporangium sp. NBC_01755]WSC98824.1 EF-hand domain-containing protein [Streptosporangium sp. NBC_01755]
MSTRLLNRKLDRAFGHMDVDGSGSIKREDLLGLGARILVGFGESPTAPTGSRLAQGFEGIWRTLAAEIDVDGDRAISPAEFRAGMTSAFVEGDRFDAVFGPAAEAAARLCDADGDGTVGPDDLWVMMAAFGTSREDVAAAFERLDGDGDGMVSVGELVEATRQFYTSTDPDVAGNWLFGPL